MTFEHMIFKLYFGKCVSCFASHTDRLPACNQSVFKCAPSHQMDTRAFLGASKIFWYLFSFRQFPYMQISVYNLPPLKFPAAIYEVF